MNFSTTKEKLLRAALLAERIVGKKESLPVLSCLLLEVGDELRVRATNLEAGVGVVVQGEVGARGVIAVPAGIFAQTLRTAGDKVKITDESGNLLVESRGSKTLIKAVPHQEFPNISSAEAGDGVEMVRTTLLHALQSVAYAASPSMIRPELGSVLLVAKNKTLVTVATDSFRLAEKTLQKAFGDGEFEVLVPLKHVHELIHVLERISDENVSLAADESQLCLRAEGVEFVSRVTDAPFPNYKEIIPKQFAAEVTLLRSDFSEMLKKARVFSGAEQRVGLHVYPKKKVFDATAQSAAIGEMSDSLEAALSGEDVDINFNIGYLADCLPLIQSDSIVLGFSGTGRPLVIRGVSDSSLTYLVMPLNR